MALLESSHPVEVVIMKTLQGVLRSRVNGEWPAPVNPRVFQSTKEGFEAICSRRRLFITTEHQVSLGAHIGLYYAGKLLVLEIISDDQPKMGLEPGWFAYGIWPVTKEESDRFIAEEYEHRSK